MKPFQQMTILGVGLIGASLARSCKARKTVNRIVGFGRNAGTLKKAEELGIIDAGSTDLKSAVEESDLIVLCTPVGVLADRVREMIPFLKPGCLLTDAGSVKGSMVREIDAMLPDSLNYVGAHPIAGGEKSGLEASSGDLLTGAKCIITPTLKTQGEALERVTEFWTAVGMVTVGMDPDEHDMVFGALSHLPHVVAFALMNTVAQVQTENHHEILSFSGGGLRDITRIASSDPVMWRDICLKNRDAVVHLIDQYQETLAHIKTLIEENRANALEEAFTQSNGYRGKLMESRS